MMWAWQLRQYGLTPEQYEELLASQLGGCAVCGWKPKPGSRIKHLHVDHNHKTGGIRGLLCWPCNNWGLGAIRDDPRRAHGMIRYLRKHFGDPAP